MLLRCELRKCKNLIFLHFHWTKNLNFSSRIDFGITLYYLRAILCQFFVTESNTSYVASQTYFYEIFVPIRSFLRVKLRIIASEPRPALYILLFNFTPSQLLWKFGIIFFMHVCVPVCVSLCFYFYAPLLSCMWICCGTCMLMIFNVIDICVTHCACVYSSFLSCIFVAIPA